MMDDIPPLTLVNGRIRWNPVLPQQKLRELYENDAAGLRDESLVDDVGVTIFARCLSIHAATEAHHGRVACASCSTVIERTGHDKDEILTCKACAWQVDWRTYLRSYQGKQLFGGAAYPEYLGFLERFPAARGYAEKMLAIDRVIHAFHVDLQRNIPGGRTAAANLVSGKLVKVFELLDELACGERSTGGLTESKQVWRDGARTIPWLRNFTPGED